MYIAFNDSAESGEQSISVIVALIQLAAMQKSCQCQIANFERLASWFYNWFTVDKATVGATVG